MSNYSEQIEKLAAPNPLLKALNLIANKEDFMLQSKVLLKKADVLKAIKGKDAYEVIALKKRFMDKFFFLPDDETWEVYCSLKNAISTGYLAKNINDEAYFKQINEKLFSSNQLSKSSSSGGYLCGPAGYGKTMTVERVLNTIPQVIEHNHQETATKTPLKQIVWVKVTCSTSSKKATLRSILKEVHRLSGSIYSESTKYKSVDHYLKEVTSVFLQYSVGILVIDESQWFSSGRRTDKDGINASFLQEIYNEFNVPVLLIGTPILRDAIVDSKATQRRYEQFMSKNYSCMTIDKGTIVEVITVLFSNYIFPESEEKITKAQINKVLVFCRGNMSILLKLAEKALVLSSENNDKNISSELLDYAMDTIKMDVETFFHGERNYYADDSKNEKNKQSSKPLEKKAVNKQNLLLEKLSKVDGMIDINSFDSGVSK
ncbi:hypothetical protein CWB60_11005 [Pseudoalteromonas sp. S327]|uniref:ATP-binding protein n=1 Tax=unclassified Pseudoalteromonas TaxID=194690 RepID=UPI00110BB747|nr:MULTISPECIES: ATP-binding protein [unclassified Pseudoalteromonas]TMO06331.1 hypothetical protein CWB60_11005 [Pseudoalteromonas sp. S327]TMO18952.1 hypothetical protein CWB59_07090 [Pseudoalteromonas sp. S326]